MFRKLVKILILFAVIYVLLKPQTFIMFRSDYLNFTYSGYKTKTLISEKLENIKINLLKYERID